MHQDAHTLYEALLNGGKVITQDADGVGITINDSPIYIFLPFGLYQISELIWLQE